MRVLQNNTPGEFSHNLSSECIENDDFVNVSSSVHNTIAEDAIFLASRTLPPGSKASGKNHHVTKDYISGDGKIVRDSAL